MFPSHGEAPSREELVPHSSKAWPDEALERGLPTSFAKKKENWGRGRELEGELPLDSDTPLEPNLVIVVSWSLTVTPTYQQLSPIMTLGDDE